MISVHFCDCVYIYNNNDVVARSFSEWSEGTIEHPAAGFRKIRVSRDTADRWNLPRPFFFSFFFLRIFTTYFVEEMKKKKLYFVIIISGIFLDKKQPPSFPL